MATARHLLTALAPFIPLFITPAAPALAQTWPAKPVTMVVGYPPGSGIDNVARFLAEGLRERTGQPWIVENKPGAVGNLAAQAVARAAPDGYTVLFTPNSSHGINPHMFKKPGFDPIKDFQPVTTILTLGFVLVVNPQTVPVNTVAELTAYIKARPGKLAFASGNATGRVTAEWYRQITGIDAVLTRNGEVVAEGRSDAVLGNPVTAVAWLARKVDSFGVRLRAGDIVLPGSCTRAIDVRPGDEFVADFAGLGAVRLSFG